MKKRGLTVDPAQVVTVGVCPRCGADTTLPHNLVKGYCRLCYIAMYNKVRSKLPDVKAKAAVMHDRWYRRQGRLDCLRNRRRRGEQEKRAVIEAYGGKCACCGEARPEFLTIDHIYGDGGAERKLINGGAFFYHHLRMLGYPKDRYQSLCFNCNFAAGHSFPFGICPHQRERRAAEDKQKRLWATQYETNCDLAAANLPDMASIANEATDLALRNMPGDYFCIPVEEACTFG